MKISVEIRSADEREIYQEIFGTNDVIENQSYDIGNSVTIQPQRSMVFGGLDFSQVTNLLIDLAADTSKAFFAAWLYDKLKNKKIKLFIKGKETNIDKNDIENNIKI